MYEMRDKGGRGKERAGEGELDTYLRIVIKHPVYYNNQILPPE